VCNHLPRFIFCQGLQFSTWIGEDEENTAWGYLLKARRVLSQYDLARGTTAPAGAQRCCLL